MEYGIFQRYVQKYFYWILINGGTKINSRNKKPINCDKEIVDKFDDYYPRLKELFVKRSLILALQDKAYFEEVFFNPIFMEVK